MKQKIEIDGLAIHAPSQLPPEPTQEPQKKKRPRSVHCHRKAKFIHENKVNKKHPFFPLFKFAANAKVSKLKSYRLWRKMSGLPEIPREERREVIKEAVKALIYHAAYTPDKDEFSGKYKFKCRLSTEQLAYACNVANEYQLDRDSKSFHKYKLADKNEAVRVDYQRFLNFLHEFDQDAAGYLECVTRYDADKNRFKCFDVYINERLFADLGIDVEMLEKCINRANQKGFSYDLARVRYMDDCYDKYNILVKNMTWDKYVGLTATEQKTFFKTSLPSLRASFERLIGYFKKLKNLDSVQYRIIMKKWGVAEKCLTGIQNLINDFTLKLQGIKTDEAKSKLDDSSQERVISKTAAIRNLMAKNPELSFAEASIMLTRSLLADDNCSPIKH